MMQLASFEQYVSKKTLQRGQDYFNTNKVFNFKNEDNHFNAFVAGTNVYLVAIELDENDYIMNSTCDCPHDAEIFCKHSVAVLYQILNYQAEQLKKILKKWNKEQLVEKLYTLLIQHPELQPEFREKKKKIGITKPKGTEELYAKKIKQSISLVKGREGFIPSYLLPEAFQGIYETLDASENAIEATDFVLAMKLGLLAQRESIRAIQFADDSNGEIFDVTISVSELMDDLILRKPEIPLAKHKTFFNTLIQEGSRKLYESWPDSAYACYMWSIQFCDSSSQRKKLEQKIAGLESNYYDPKPELLVAIMLKFGEEEAAYEYMYIHRKKSAFLRRLLDRAKKEKNYQEMATLLEELDYSNSRNFEWLQDRLEVYEQLAQIDKICDTLMWKYIHGDQASYSKLKELCPDWENYRQQVIEAFKENTYSSTYSHFLQQEKLLAELLAYCQAQPERVQLYFRDLVSDFYEEAHQLYYDWADAPLTNNPNRDKYRTVANLLRDYEKQAGREFAVKLANKIRAQYPKRTALFEEIDAFK